MAPKVGGSNTEEDSGGEGFFDRIASWLQRFILNPAAQFFTSGQATSPITDPFGENTFDRFDPSSDLYFRSIPLSAPIGDEGDIFDVLLHLETYLGLERGTLSPQQAVAILQGLQDEFGEEDFATFYDELLSGNLEPASTYIQEDTPVEDTEEEIVSLGPDLGLIGQTNIFGPEGGIWDPTLPYPDPDVDEQNIMVLENVLGEPEVYLDPNFIMLQPQDPTDSAGGGGGGAEGGGGATGGDAGGGAGDGGGATGGDAGGAAGGQGGQVVDDTPSDFLGGLEGIEDLIDIPTDEGDRPFAAVGNGPWVYIGEGRWVQIAPEILTQQGVVIDNGDGTYSVDPTVYENDENWVRTAEDPTWNPDNPEVIDIGITGDITGEGELYEPDTTTGEEEGSTLYDLLLGAGSSHGALERILENSDFYPTQPQTGTGTGDGTGAGTGAGTGDGTGAGTGTGTGTDTGIDTGIDTGDIRDTQFIDENGNGIDDRDEVSKETQPPDRGPVKDTTSRGELPTDTVGTGGVGDVGTGTQGGTGTGEGTGTGDGTGIDLGGTGMLAPTTTPVKRDPYTPPDLPFEWELVKPIRLFDIIDYNKSLRKF